MFEQEITVLVQEFRTAIYGKDVRKTYADIAELVCVRAMRELDHAVEQGNQAEQQGIYAKTQGDYAKDQGDYAKAQGDYAKQETGIALTEISSTMAHMSNEFNGMQDTLESTENGALLLEINNILKTHRMATDTDVDKILAGMYVEEDEESSIFEIGSFQDIDDILSGTYMDTEK